MTAAEASNLQIKLLRILKYKQLIFGLYGKSNRINYNLLFG